MFVKWNIRNNIISNIHFIPVTYTKIGDKAYTMKIDQDAAGADTNHDSDDEDDLVELKNLHMSDVVYKYESSIYSSSSEGSRSNQLSPIPDDANSMFDRLSCVRSIHLFPSSSFCLQFS